MADWLDWLYAPQCAACGEPAETLCARCVATLMPIGAACPRCGEPADEHDDKEVEADAHVADDIAAPAPAPCARCRRSPLPLAAIVSPWRFGGQLAVAIRRMKLGRRMHVARSLAPLWAPLVGAAASEHGALVVPVPTHWKRRVIRGFDHTWMLASHACRAAEIEPPQPLLVRVRGAAPQRGLTAGERRANLDGAFAVRCVDRVRGQTIVLVDDVVTTGATIAAAARALLAAGATSVIGVALSRAASVR